MGSALLMDLYELTMAEGYWRLGMADLEAVFTLTFRTLPFGSGFALAAGLESVVNWCQNLFFNDQELAYLASLPSPTKGPLFSPAFLDYLSTLRFSCSIDAVEEGRPIFPREPLIRVQGPLLQAQLLETALLNLVNFQTLIATKAARLRLAAQDDRLFEFGARRAQGVDGALSASRASFLGGCDATSNLLAGYHYAIPVAGTHAHSWVMAFESELAAFKGYRKAMPHNCLFLVDTYHTAKGVENAIAIAQEMVESGEEPLGVRLDSGDLCQLSQETRRALDAAGLTSMKIVATNDLDEWQIASLKERGAAIDLWGVGTRLATGHPQAALDGVYKLSALRDRSGQWVEKMKESDSRGKKSDPGILQVCRLPSRDLIYPVSASLKPEGEELLKPVFRSGELVYSLPKLTEMRERAMVEVAALPEGVRRLSDPDPYPVEFKK